MNKKNKVLLSTVALLLLSGVAATSSTFAWFTTVRTGTINYSDATATSTDANLSVVYKSSLNTTMGTPTSVDNLVTITGLNNVTDISGDGVNFFKPVWASQADHLSGVASVINAVTAADDHYVDFTVTVSRTGTQGMKVYLGKGTAFTDKGTVTGDIVPALRLVALNGTTVMTRWAPVAETTPTYLTGTAGTAYSLTTHTLAADSTLKTGAFTADNPTTQAVADAAGYMVADLSSVSSVDVTFRAWIEGTDAQTKNDILGEGFSLAINLYGLSA